MKYLVTGGAGFIGSHVVDRLIEEGGEVTVYDNLTSGRKLFIEHHLDNPKFRLVTADVFDLSALDKEMSGQDFVFHLSAHADVRSGFEDHSIDHEQNLEATRNVLESMVKNKVSKIAFASTSSVYGDASTHPTPENYPFEPTSLYGATKAAAESYIWTYASYYGMTSYVFRFVSWIGERYTHGIIYDVLKKIAANPDRIELFSDGSPKKSSLYVKDGVDAIFAVINNAKEQWNIYNLGHDEVLTVDEIVSTILTAAGSPNTEKNWLGKGSNWKGDNEFVLLAIDKLKGLGWKPTVPIRDGIKKTVDYLLSNRQLLE